MLIKSRSLYVGLLLANSLDDAFLLYVEPLRSNFRWYLTEEGSRLFITTIRILVLPHCRGERERDRESIKGGRERGLREGERIEGGRED